MQKRSPSHATSTRTCNSARQCSQTSAASNSPRLSRSIGVLRGIDEALGLAARRGWAHVELSRAPVLQADPEAIELIVGLVNRLFERRPRVRCEMRPDDAEMRPERVAVGVSHNDQKDLLRSALSARGHEGVVVETANKLQGLEFDLVVAWHPLAGIPEPDPFHLDPGRLCVLLTRHRHACLVIGRSGDAEPLEDRPPPSTPAYLGWRADPVLDGWEIHRRVFSAIEDFPYPVLSDVDDSWGRFRREKKRRSGLDDPRPLYARDAAWRDRILVLAYVAELAPSRGRRPGRSGLGRPRIFLKKLVGEVLDQVDQHPDFDPHQAPTQITIADDELTRVEQAARGIASVDEEIELDL